MCEHKNIRPIVETDDKGEKVVFAAVCPDCFMEFTVSPMTLTEYNRIPK